MGSSRAAVPGLPALALAVTCALATACGAGTLDAVDAPTIDVGLVAHWRFDDGQGATVLDSSGNGLAGALTGGLWIADGQFAGALYLTRGDYVTVPSFPAATADWTVSAWVRYAQADIGTDLASIVTTEVPSAHGDPSIVVTPGGWELQGPASNMTSELEFSFRDSTGHYSALLCCQIQPDLWMHVTAVVDSRALTMSLYQGAVMQSQTSIPSVIMPGNTILHIGIEQAVDGLIWPFQGAVDEIRIYQRALSAPEIAHLDGAP